jgi:hypothetical protein
MTTIPNTPLPPIRGGSERGVGRNFLPGREWQILRKAVQCYEPAEFRFGYNTEGFSVLNNELAISHHFQTLIYQGLPGAMLEYVGFCWVIFGCGGYNMVTVHQNGGSLWWLTLNITW